MKIGDRVEAINSGWQYNVGDKGRVENYSDDALGCSIDIYFDNGRSIHSCNGDNFKVIKEEPMNTFKKSDLKTGMMVQFADKSWNLVLTNSESLVKYDTTLSFWGFEDHWFESGICYDDSLVNVDTSKFSIIKVASCGNLRALTIQSFVNHSDPTAIPGFHIIWSRESDEKSKAADVVKALQKALDDAKRRLEELG